MADPWQVVSETPAPAPAAAGKDPWAVVSQTPVKPESGVVGGALKKIPGVIGGALKAAQKKGWDVLGSVANVPDIASKETLAGDVSALKKIPGAIGDAAVRGLVALADPVRYYGEVKKQISGMSPEQVGAQVVEPAAEFLAPFAGTVARGAAKVGSALGKAGVGEEWSSGLKALKPVPKEPSKAELRRAEIAKASEAQKAIVHKEDAARKASIQDELRRRIAEERTAERQGRKDLADSARERIKMLHEQLKVHESVPSDPAQLHKMAAEQSGLPEAYAPGTREPTGEGMRADAEAVYKKASEQAEQGGNAFYDRLRERARDLQNWGLSLMESEPGKALSAELEKIRKGSIVKRPEGISPVAEASQVFSDSASRLESALRGRETSAGPGMPQVPEGADFSTRLGAQLEGLKPQPTVIAQPDIKAILEEVQRLKNIEATRDVQGYDSVIRAHAKSLRTMTEKALSEWLGEGYYDNKVYASLMRPVNRFNNAVGRLLTGREEIPYFNKDELLHTTPPDKIPQAIFSSKENVDQLQMMIGEDRMMTHASRYLADELGGMKSSDEIAKWLKDPKNSWLNDRPQLKIHAIKYQEAYAKLEGNAAAAEKAAASLKTTIDAIPEDLAKKSKDLANQRRVNETKLKGDSQAQYDALQKEMQTRLGIADEIDAYLSEQPPDKVPKAIIKIEGIIKQLPGATNEELAQFRDSLNAIRNDVDNANRRALIRKMVLKGMAGATGAGALIYEGRKLIGGG